MRSRGAGTCWAGEGRGGGAGAGWAARGRFSSGQVPRAGWTLGGGPVRPEVRHAHPHPHHLEHDSPVAVVPAPPPSHPLARWLHPYPAAYRCRMPPAEQLFRALTRRDYLVSRSPWRAAAYLASSVLTGVPALVLLCVAGVLSFVLVGLPLLVLGGLGLAAVERRRIRIVDPAAAVSPHRTPDEPGIGAWLRVRLTEQATWRELAHALLHALVLWPLDLLAVLVAVGLPVAAVAAPLQFAADGHEARVVKTVLVTGYPQAFVAAVAGLVLLAVLLYPSAPSRAAARPSPARCSPPARVR